MANEGDIRQPRVATLRNYRRGELGVAELRGTPAGGRLARTMAPFPRRVPMEAAGPRGVERPLPTRTS